MGSGEATASATTSYTPAGSVSGTPLATSVAAPPPSGTTLTRALAPSGSPVTFTVRTPSPVQEEPASSLPVSTESSVEDPVQPDARHATPKVAVRDARAKHERVDRKFMVDEYPVVSRNDRELQKSLRERARRGPDAPRSTRWIQRPCTRDHRCAFTEAN